MLFKLNDCRLFVLLGSLVGVTISHEGNNGNLSSSRQMNKSQATLLQSAFSQMANSSTRIPIITQTGTIQVKR